MGGLAVEASGDGAAFFEELVGVFENCGGVGIDLVLLKGAVVVEFLANKAEALEGAQEDAGEGFLVGSIDFEDLLGGLERFVA